MTIFKEGVFRQFFAENFQTHRIHRVKVGEDGSIFKVEGAVILLRRVTRNGKAVYAEFEKKLRWDGAGKAFSHDSNVRQRKYDIDAALRDIHSRNLKQSTDK